jgi:pimeloyl-ACP methyl ester carboxylesterase
MAMESNYPTRQVAVAPGVELACIDCGQGPAIVFIPHWTFTKEVFWRQIEALSPDHRVIAYDPRSQGKSTFSLEGNDYITHAHDLGAGHTEGAGGDGRPDRHRRAAQIPLDASQRLDRGHAR